MDELEKEVQEIREANDQTLGAFEAWLLNKKGLSTATANKHVGNMAFYINQFLLYDDVLTAADGIDEVDVFLGYWFIRKAMWSNEKSLRANATSLKQFYDFLAEQGVVTQSAVQAMKRRIKEELPEWIATVNRYNDPLVDVDDVWQ